MLADNKPAQAVSLLRAYLASHLADADARYLLAFALFRASQPSESLAEYTHAAQLQRPTPAQLRQVALDYVLLNDFTDADKWLTRSTTEEPGSSERLVQPGRVKYTENRFAEAIRCFERALALTPHLVKAEDNLGLAYAGLNQNGQAAAAYREAIAWDAASPTSERAAAAESRDAPDRSGAAHRSTALAAPGRVNCAHRP